MINTKDDFKKIMYPKDVNLAKALAAHAKARWMNMAVNYKVKVDDITVAFIGMI